MYTNSKLAKAVRISLWVSAASAMAATHVYAQEPNAEEDVEKISVTGSRILAPGVESSSPIFSLDSE